MNVRVCFTHVITCNVSNSQTLTNTFTRSTNTRTNTQAPEMQQSVPKPKFGDIL